MGYDPEAFNLQASAIQSAVDQLVAKRMHSGPGDFQRLQQEAHKLSDMADAVIAAEWPEEPPPIEPEAKAASIPPPAVSGAEPWPEPKKPSRIEEAK